MINGVVPFEHPHLFKALIEIICLPWVVVIYIYIHTYYLEYIIYNFVQYMSVGCCFTKN